MRLEVELSDLKDTSRSLHRTAEEMEDLRSDIQRAMNSLTSRTLSQSGVQSTFQQLMRDLARLQNELDELSDLTSRKRDEYKDADTNGQNIDVEKLKGFLAFAIGTTLDFLPVVGNAKGIIEAITGRDLVTGVKLEAWERTLGVLGPLGKGVNKSAKLAGFAADAMGLGGGAGRQMDKASDLTSTVSRSADEAADRAGGAVKSSGGGAGAVERSAGDMAGSGPATPGKKPGEAGNVESTGDVHNEARKRNQALSANEDGASGQGVNGLNINDAAKVAAVSTAASTLSAAGFKLLTKNNQGEKLVDTANQSKAVKTDVTTHVSNKGGGDSPSSLKVEQQNVAKSHASSQVKDPIHAATGYQFIHHEAISLYGAATWPVTIMYHSALLQPGAMGPGWSHSYEVRLSLDRKDEGSLELYWTAGRHNQFERREEGLWLSPNTDVCLDELVELPNGYELRTRQERETYHFDPTGRLLRLTNANGLTVDLAYSEDGILKELKDRVTGRALQLKYQEDGLLQSIEDTARKVSFAYNDQGIFNVYTDANGGKTEMTHDEAGRIITLAEDGILQFENEFDDRGRIICQKDAYGRHSYLKYDDTSRPGYIITTVTNASGTERVLVHNDNLKLLEVVAEDGAVTRYTYNERGQQTSVINPLGETEYYRYDEAGHLIEHIDPVGSITRYSYTPDHLDASETDAEGNTTRYQYDDQGRIHIITRSDNTQAYWTYREDGQAQTYQDYAGVKWKYLYDEQGQLSGVRDPEGRETRVSMDEAGRVNTLTDPLGGQTQRVYDGNGNLTQLTDAVGRTWTTAYDAGDRPIQVTLPSGATTTYQYSVSGKVLKTVDALGHSTSYTYDEEDRLIAERNPLGEETQLSYDEASRLTTVTDPLGRTTHYAYDKVGRLQSVTDGEGRIVGQLTYDEAGRPIALKNGLGHTTRRFNTLHQVVEETDAEGRVQTFRYDGLHRLVEVIQSGEGKEPTAYQQGFDAEHRQTAYMDANQNRTELSYDPSGRLLQEKLAGGHLLNYGYDARGWLAKRINARAQETRYGYDASGRLVESADEAGTTKVEYTADGQVSRISEGDTNTLYKYNARGELIQTTDTFGYEISYAYDAAGRLTTLTYPDGQQVEYRYNAAGELSEVKDWKGRLTRYRYDASGKLIETNRPNGSREERSYDAAGQLARLTDSDRHGIRLQQYRYQYSPGGQLIQEEEKQYTYDHLRRLSSGAWPGRRIHYSYDPAGNISEVADTSEQQIQQMHYTHDNRLQRLGDYPVEMDADGNLLYVTDGESMAAYTYDARNRLVQAGKHRYRYSAQGHRIEQLVRKKSIRYVVDESQELSRVLMEVDSEGNILSRYIYGLGLIGREDASGNHLSYHSDMRGSTTLLTDETGRVTDRYTYGIYGELEKHEGTTYQPFCYNGRDGVMTDANGLYYMRARYYDPKLKRFLNRDIVRGGISDGQTLNRYSYVNGNPISYVDPLGLFKSETTANIDRQFLDRPTSGDNKGNLLPNKEIVPVINYELVKKYLRDIESKTGLTVHKKQIDLLKDSLRNNKYEKLTPKETTKHRNKFTSRLKDNLIKEWEIETNQSWPKYTENVYDRHGEIARRIGQPYDAHHIIENNYKGPHEWWNVHPAKYPDEHQSGIHGKGAPAGKLFPRR